jgi:ribosomal protein L3
MVDVTGTSIGKGFVARLNAITLSLIAHRVTQKVTQCSGSIGMAQDQIESIPW